MKYLLLLAALYTSSQQAAAPNRSVFHDEASRGLQCILRTTLEDLHRGLITILPLTAKVPRWNDYGRDVTVQKLLEDATGQSIPSAYFKEGTKILFNGLTFELLESLEGSCWLPYQVKVFFNENKNA